LVILNFRRLGLGILLQSGHRREPWTNTNQSTNGFNAQIQPNAEYNHRFCRDFSAILFKFTRDGGDSSGQYAVLFDPREIVYQHGRKLNQGKTAFQTVPNLMDSTACKLSPTKRFPAQSRKMEDNASW
jgi:hypothetical protein